VLRRYRNGVFHFQKEYNDERFMAFMKEGYDSVSWIRPLNQQFGLYFLDAHRARNAHNSRQEGVNITAPPLLFSLPLQGVGGKGFVVVEPLFDLPAPQQCLMQRSLKTLHYFRISRICRLNRQWDSSFRVLAVPTVNSIL
jgi:hypothetical protein